MLRYISCLVVLYFLEVCVTEYCYRVGFNTLKLPRLIFGVGKGDKGGKGSGKSGKKGKELLRPKAPPQAPPTHPIASKYDAGGHVRIAVIELFAGLRTTHVAMKLIKGLEIVFSHAAENALSPITWLERMA